ncbi:MAG: tetratricopeptide repeat protein, partial [Pseudomonadales bacterium]|nr:tetratricopeptide repeat protein [Pseudomonadales bacterium]
MNFTDAASDKPARLAALTTTLAELQSRCLRSSEYYALLGAAQLNSGQLDVASESLERALLLDPKNGSAQIDYAEALFAAGQLFPALQLNETILGREDLPAALRETLTQRD